MPMFFTEWMHFVGMLLIGSATTAQIFVLKTPPSRDGVRALVRGVIIYSIGVLVVIGTGVSRSFRGDPGIEGYLHNGLFIAALVLFAAMLLWSVRPIRRALAFRTTFKAGGGLPDPAVWKRTARILKVQLMPLTVIVLLKVLMVNGY